MLGANGTSDKFAMDVPFERFGEEFGVVMILNLES